MKKVKEFFGTPKKAIITSVCLIGGLGALAAGSVAVTGSVARNNAIGNIAAEDIALKDAGIDYSQARIRRTEFDFDNGQYVYEIEFYSNGVEYDYKIQASDGTILWRDSEPMDGYVAASNQSKSQQEQQAAEQAAQQAAEQAAQQAAEQAAKQAAEQAAKQAAEQAAQQAAEQAAQQAAEQAAKQAAEQAAQQQPVQQPTQQQPVQQPTQQQSVQQPVTNNTSYISVDEAKNIALGRAGLSASNVNFVKAKLENDDGRTEYEIEFYSGTMEYDCTIDASTGTVLEYGVESIYD